MSPDSQSIKEISNAFGDCAPGLGLASFWEGTATQMAGVCPNDLFILTPTDHNTYPRFLRH
jgi:hypothetical protein